MVPGKNVTQYLDRLIQGFSKIAVTRQRHPPVGTPAGERSGCLLLFLLFAHPSVPQELIIANDVVELGGDDEAVHRRGPLAAAVGAGERRVPGKGVCSP